MPIQPTPQVDAHARRLDHFYDMRGRQLWTEPALDNRLPAVGQIRYRTGKRWQIRRFALADDALHVNLVAEQI